MQLAHMFSKLLLNLFALLCCEQVSAFTKHHPLCQHLLHCACAAIRMHALLRCMHHQVRMLPIVIGVEEGSDLWELWRDGYPFSGWFVS
jgi:hypothetical protein